MIICDCTKTQINILRYNLIHCFRVQFTKKEVKLGGLVDGEIWANQLIRQHSLYPFSQKQTIIIYTTKCMMQHYCQTKC